MAFGGAGMCALPALFAGWSEDGHDVIPYGIPVAKNFCVTSLEPRRRAGERAVSTMLRTSRRTGPPLISELALAALQMRPLRNLPASWQESVNGADVLLDVGDNMVVFGRDQEWLLSLIRCVGGEAWVKAFCFSGSPSRGVWLRRASS